MSLNTKHIIIAVCSYHVALLMFFIFYMVWIHNFDNSKSGASSLILLAAISGMAGSALVASRYVVIAIREQLYDTNRLAWQLLTPLHGGVLAVFAYFLYKTPSVAHAETTRLASTATSAENIVLFSSMVGFAAEIFVKRLIAVAEAMFGEGGGKGRTTIEDLEGGRRPVETATTSRGDGQDAHLNGLPNASRGGGA